MQRRRGWCRSEDDAVGVEIGLAKARAAAVTTLTELESGLGEEVAAVKTMGSELKSGL